MGTLRLTDVGKAYGRGADRVIALAGISLSFEAGSMTAVCGPSGSGKSTFLALAGGLERPSAGEVSVDGQTLGALTDSALLAFRAQSVAYVFQEYNLVGVMTALENVSLPLELTGHRGMQARQAAEAALESVGLAGLGSRFPDEMSGGQRQRVAIARALASRKPLVLADEPTGALDTTSGEQMVALLRRLAVEGSAVVVATHDPAVMAACDRRVALVDGRVAREAA